MRLAFLILLGPLLLPALPLPAQELPSAVLDADHDGVPDGHDQCPDTPQVQKTDPQSTYAPLFDKEQLSPEPASVAVDATGCPRDTDHDGVADYLDFCPDNTQEELSAGIHPNGCPKHSDSDGTPDYRDKCPDTPRGVSADRFGCPVEKKP